MDCTIIGPSCGYDGFEILDRGTLFKMSSRIEYKYLGLRGCSLGLAGQFDDLVEAGHVYVLTRSLGFQL